jgi:hypothetical protein
MPQLTAYEPDRGNHRIMKTFNETPTTILTLIEPQTVSAELPHALRVFDSIAVPVRAACFPAALADAKER